jgi:hypothetical protein
MFSGFCKASGSSSIVQLRSDVSTVRREGILLARVDVKHLERIEMSRAFARNADHTREIWIAEFCALDFVVVLQHRVQVVGINWL